MQFYKKREFGTLVGDTFLFFKEYGKNYFKNYFLINGLLLIILMVLAVFGYREFFMQLVGGNTGGQSYFMEQYFQQNSGILIFLVVLFFILAMAISVVSYSYPIFYLKRVSQTETKTVKSDEILGDIKNNFGRIIIMMLGLTFIVGPVFLIVFGISYLLMLIVIGFFLLLLIAPATVNSVNFIMYDYLQTKKGFLESLSFAIRAQVSYPSHSEKTPFWKYWGTTIVIYFIINIVTSIFTFVPMIMYFATLVSVPSHGGGFEENPFQGTMGILFFVIYGISMLVSLVLMNVMLVASGLMYYDNRTDLHQQMDILEIDSIGTHEG